MKCDCCAARARDRLSGVYQYACLECCAALILSTGPDRGRAKPILAAIARYKAAPNRANIFCRLKEILNGENNDIDEKVLNINADQFL